MMFKMSMRAEYSDEVTYFGYIDLDDRAIDEGWLRDLPMLTGLDWYGLTMFNRLQMRRVPDELAQLAEQGLILSGHDVVEAVRQRCLTQSNVHKFLVFSGG